MNQAQMIHQNSGVTEYHTQQALHKEPCAIGTVRT